MNNRGDIVDYFLPILFLLIIVFFAGAFFVNNLHSVSREILDSSSESFCKAYAISQDITFVSSSYHYSDLLSPKIFFTCKTSTALSASFGGGKLVDNSRINEEDFSVSKEVIVKWAYEGFYED